MMSLEKVAISIFTMSAITFFTRIFPFIFFKDKNPPDIIIFAEKYIPPMIMTILVIYCLKDINFLLLPFGTPEIISITFVAAVHIWRKNQLISILGGTSLYMALVQSNVISGLIGKPGL